MEEISLQVKRGLLGRCTSTACAKNLVAFVNLGTLQQAAQGLEQVTKRTRVYLLFLMQDEKYHIVLNYF
jgi:hypothetical protein